MKKIINEIKNEVKKWGVDNGTDESLPNDREKATQDIEEYIYAEYGTKTSDWDITPREIAEEIVSDIL
ncbi:hypothetical protein [Persephonella sp.]